MFSKFHPRSNPVNILIWQFIDNVNYLLSRLPSPHTLLFFGPGAMTAWGLTVYRPGLLFYNLVLSTGVVCHGSRQELKIQDNESYTEYWCRMSWKTWLSKINNSPVSGSQREVTFSGAPLQYKTMWSSPIFLVITLILWRDDENVNCLIIPIS